MAHSVQSLLPVPVEAHTEFKLLLPPRAYQVELAEPGLSGQNYICVAPTGTGKTLVAALLIADHLQKNKGKEKCHVAFIVKTRNLADQQTQKMRDYIQDVKVDVYTGDSSKTVIDSLKENNVSVCTAGKLLHEIRRGHVKLSQFSMIVFDECHSTLKSHVYAEIMKMYLEQQQKEKLSIQIIGMTASPGAGDNPTRDTCKTIDHLLMLMALMDAKGGIKMVRENTSDLQKYMKSSQFTRKIVQPRNLKTDEFVAKIIHVMDEIETMLAFDDIKKCAFKKWSPEYETKIQQIIQSLEMSLQKKFRDSISCLKQLYRYCTALSVYMDLRADDVIQALEKFSDLPQKDSSATPVESHLKRIKETLLQELKSLQLKDNPMLTGMQEIFVEKFQERNSKAMVFVRTKKHTAALKEWMIYNPILREIGVKPGILTGHTSERGAGMTMVDQKEVMDEFREGKVNVLIATSVGEEGIDVPECNIVIRYQHVSNEIAKVQTEGRARAEESHGYTILSSSSKKKYQDMQNDSLNQLVNKILEDNLLPEGKLLEAEIEERQRKIIQERMLKRLYKEQQRSCDAEKVKIFCKKCKEFACYGSDISCLEESESIQNIVHKEEFKKKYITKAHESPRHMTANVVKVKKIHCAKCESDWGVECFWTRIQQWYPMLKCKSFVFEINGFPVLVKRWSYAPFQPEPLSTKVKLDPDDSEEE